jgi:subtilase family serine protease
VPAVAGATAGSASVLASVMVQPGVLHAAKSAKQPPTTADCEAAFDVACYEPGQIEQAYNLPALYAKGITGKGATIVIVDSFGSPTITSDLNAFDKTFGLTAPPSFKIIQPAGKVPPST